MDLRNSDNSSMHHQPSDLARPDPISFQPRFEDSSSGSSALVAIYAEARESKALVRERLLFRLAKHAGAPDSEVAPEQVTPVAPASESQRTALGDPLGAFLRAAVEQAERSV